MTAFRSSQKQDATYGVVKKVFHHLQQKRKKSGADDAAAEEKYKRIFLPLWQTTDG